LSVKETQDLLAYFLEYVVANMLLPGRIENWVLIADMAGLNVLSVPYSMFQEIFNFMQNNYRARLYKGYVLNAPWTFSTIWTAVKKLIEETTALKMVITSSASDPLMLTHINPEQLETKYGGKSAVLTAFWPPVAASGEFFIEGETPSEILTLDD
jgi:CRAL/TRIO domain